MRRYPDYTKAYWKPWNYVAGYCLYGFEMLHRSTGDARYFDFAKRYIDSFVDAEGNLDERVALTNLDNMMTGNTIVWMYEVTKDERYRKAAERMRRAFATYPRNSDGGFWHGNKMTGQMWIDGVFMGQMFLTRYGKSIGEREACFDEAVRQITIYAKRGAKGKTGLFYHGFSENQATTRWADPKTGLSCDVWSEGLGWYALILVETLAVLPEGYPGRSELVAIVRDLASGLARTQDSRNGRWYQVVDRGDDPDNWTDTSGSAMFVYMLQRAIELGLLSAEDYAPVVRKGYQGIVARAHVNAEGLVDIYGACDGVGVQVDYAHYIHYPQKVNAKEAVGGFLWATAIVEKPKMAPPSPGASRAEVHLDLQGPERERILKNAGQFLKEQPVTITATHNPRSAGGAHDFSSEGDYWWPDPQNPDGPYVQRDGMTNPVNFVAHRQAMVRMSIQVGTLVSAYRLTGDPRYARHAIRHLRAWFVDEATRMNPSLLYAQAIKGRATGRGIGVIDTVHLVEPARAAQLLEQDGVLKDGALTGIKKWFADYLEWLTTHQYGLDEMKAANNHGSCWALQVAAFASFTGDRERVELCRRRFKEVLLPGQMAGDGSFPQELRRTKPYAYSIFNADALATLCWIASSPEDNLWEFTTADGKSMGRGVEYIYPFIKDKSRWPLRPDVMDWEQWPVRSPVLLFSGLALKRQDYLETWMTLAANPTDAEVLRNLPVRHPLLWVPFTRR